MNDEPVRTTDMVDITDCFEAVSVFRVWRNVFFATVLICLVLLQGAFWAVDIGWVTPPAAAAAGAGSEEGRVAVAGSEQPDPGAAVPTAQTQNRFLGITFNHVLRWVQVANGVLLLGALLYWLTQLFTLLISIVGRLGGMNHICRAFFLSLVVLVLVIPWQYAGHSILVGATFSAQDLAHGFATRASGRILYYLRFSAYPVAVLAVLVLAHLRSVRWAKAILRRLEII
jgi:hypothetical protein